VLEGDAVIETSEGTPQGAVISPLLANIYLHYVYDLWVEVRRRKSSKRVALTSIDRLLLVGLYRLASRGQPAI